MMMMMMMMMFRLAWSWRPKSWSWLGLEAKRLASTAVSAWGFIANFLRFPTVQKLYKSVII